MAYIKKINPNSKDSHQTSPAYMLTFLRWENRDTENRTNIPGLNLRDPLIVINDAVQVTVNYSKRSHLQSASMVLMAGDINYASAIVPGDFLFINMLDNDERLFGKGTGASNASADSLFARARNKKPINGSHDGFKGVFRVQSVRRFLQTQPGSGQKQYYFQITATAFTEFDQVIYFNSYLYSESEREGDKFRLGNNVVKDMTQQMDKEPLDLRTTYKRLTNYLIGVGFPSNFAPQKDVPRNFNKNFLIPSDVGRLLGLTNVKNAADIFTHYVGIQKFRNRAQNDEEGLNPTGSRDGTFFDCGAAPRGTVVIIGDYWNQITAWSILTQHANLTLNEMYTSFKLSPEGRVLPSVVYRQKPFTSEHFYNKTKIDSTTFLSLPRWKVSADLIYSYSFGRDNTPRINFVQIIGKSRGLPLTSELALQSALQNYQLDDEDIKRSGLKPYITVNDFDFPTGDNKAVQSPTWSQLVFDWLNNGHLKENGNITCAGIEEPIAVGDNLQIDDYVYHIEDITHSMSQAPDGHKKFETTMKLSYGVSLDSNTTLPIYPELPDDADFTTTDRRRDYDYNNNEQMLPGVSDDQEGARQVRIQGQAQNAASASKAKANKILSKGKK